MRSFSFSLAVVALVGCGGPTRTTNASERPALATQNSSSPDAEEIPLAEFATLAARGALPEVCGNPEASLRRCFTVDQGVCERVFGAAVLECVEHADQVHLPRTITEANVDESSQTLAGCAAVLYVEALRQEGLMLQTPECQGQGQSPE